MSSRALVINEGFKLSIVVVVIIVTVILQLLKVDLVTENTSDTTKALDELVAFRGSVRYKLQVSTKILVVLSDPLQEGFLVGNLHFLASSSVGLVSKLFALARHLLLLGSVDNVLGASGILEGPSGNLQVLKHDKCLDSSELQRLEGVVDTVADTTGILADFFKVLSDQLLLLNELDVAKSLRSQLDGLVETVFTSVRHIDDLDNFGSQTVVEHVGSVQIVLEVSGTGENDAGHIDLVIGDKVLDSQLGDLPDVVVTLLLSKTGETKGGLTTTTVLLGQIDGELVNDFARVTAQSTEKSSVTVHYDEAKLLVGLEELGKGLSVELVVAKVQRGVDRLEGLKIDVDLSFLAFRGQDFTTVDDQAIGGDLVVQLETLLGRGDG